MKGEQFMMVLSRLSGGCGIGGACGVPTTVVEGRVTFFWRVEPVEYGSMRHMDNKLHLVAYTLKPQLYIPSIDCWDCRNDLLGVFELR